MVIPSFRPHLRRASSSELTTLLPSSGYSEHAGIGGEYFLPSGLCLPTPLKGITGWPLISRGTSLPAALITVFGGILSHLVLIYHQVEFHLSSQWIRGPDVEQDQ